MRLKKIKIENFRSIKNQTIELDRYNCFVGPNGAGKSTVLNALNVFFRNNDSANTDISTLSKEDFNFKNTSNPIRIYLEFVDLSDEAKSDFKAYYRNDSLHIFAEAKWDEEKRKAEIIHYGQREVIDDFSIYFLKDKEGAYASELKEIYQDLRSEFEGLPDVSTKGDMESALRSFEESNPNLTTLKDSKDQFYGVSRGANLLEKYVQWVYVPAIKDPSTEQEEARKTALGQLLERTIRNKISFEEPIQELRDELGDKYQKLLEKESEVLEGISSSLQTRLQQWSHPGTKLNLDWLYDPDKSVQVQDPYAKIEIGEDDFIGEVARSGHGLQRSFIISLLQELAEGEDENSPILLLGFEEPELFQHPPQARHIQNLLEDLSKKTSQIILTTHSPYFVSSKGFEDIKRFSKEGKSLNTVVYSSTFEEVNKLISDSLGDEPRSNTSFMAALEQIMRPSQNELFFTEIAILVEGLEDVAYLTSYLLHKERWEEFRKYGCHFILASGKSNMSRPLAIACELNIPTFVMFDADMDRHGDNGNDQKKNNKCLLTLTGNGDINPLPSDNLHLNNAIIWKTNIGKEIKQEYGTEKWNDRFQEIKDEYELDNLNKKNWYRISKVLEELLNEGWESALLEKSTNMILNFAKSVKSKQS